MKVEQRIASGAAASGASFLVGLVTSLAQVPILLSVWSPEQFGLWVIVLATFSLIVVLDFGHQEFVSQRLILAGSANIPAVRNLIGSAIRVALLVGTLEILAAIALVATPIARFGPVELAKESGVARQAAVAIIVLVTHFAIIGSIGGVLVRLYASHGMFARAVWIAVRQRVVAFVAMMGTALAGGSLIDVALAQIAVGTLFAIVVFVDIRRRFPALWPWWQSGTISFGLGNLSRSMALTAAHGAEQLGASALLTLCGRMRDPLATASFATQRTAANTANQASWLLVQPIIPEVGRYVSNTEPRKTEAALAITSIATSGVTCITALTIAPLMPWAYRLWTSNSLLLNGALLSALMTATIVRQWQTPMAVLLNASNAAVGQSAVSVVRTTALLSAGIGLTAFRNDVEALGISVVVAEVLAGIASALFARRVMQQANGFLPGSILAMSALQSVITCGGLSIGLLGLYPWLLITPVCAVACGVLTLIQIANLPPDGRDRLRRIIPWVYRGTRHSGASATSSIEESTDQSH